MAKSIRKSAKVQIVKNTENQPMICVIATIETAAGRRDGLLAVFEKLVPQVLAENGCIEYAPLVDVPCDLATTRPNVVTMVEKWESLVALEAHLATPHMAEFRKQTADMRLSLSLQILQSP
jgi:quinol monooxygenase YgiN